MNHISSNSHRRTLLCVEKVHPVLWLNDKKWTTSHQCSELTSVWPTERVSVRLLSGPGHHNHTQNHFLCCSWHFKIILPDGDKLSAFGYYGEWESKRSVGSVLQWKKTKQKTLSPTDLLHHWGLKCFTWQRTWPCSFCGNTLAALKITSPSWPKRLLS